MIKQADTLSQEELVALTPGQVLHYIDVEIALDKIIPVEPPTVDPPTPVEMPEALDVGYQLGGLIFRNKEDADLVSQMKLCKESYDYTISYDNRYLEVLEDRTVTQVVHNTKIEVQAAAAELVVFKEQNTEWKNQQNAYNEFIRKSSTSRTRVLNLVSNARDWLQSIVAGEETYEKYLKLADGNEETARRLFHDAYGGEDVRVYKAVAKSKGFTNWTAPKEEKTDD